MTDVDKEIEIQYKIHSALDIIEERCNTQNKNPELRDLFLGKISKGLQLNSSCRNRNPITTHRRRCRPCQCRCKR